MQRSDSMSGLSVSISCVGFARRPAATSSNQILKGLDVSIRDIANAIELGDVALLKGLKGIGARTAQKIIATLQGKVSKFALIRKTDTAQKVEVTDIAEPVLEVLVSQLGHRPADAKRMVAQAIERNPGIETPEALFDEVYKGERPGKR